MAGERRGGCVYDGSVCESACVGGAGFGRGGRGGGVSQQVRDDAVVSRVGVCSVK